ncbi:MAG: peptidylprolyl isomerase [bacterium]|nr:peptidylprolyl isomerase [bacterium]
MKKILTCAALSVALLSGCTFMHKDSEIIKVNGEAITQSEFDTAIDRAIDNSPMAAFGGSQNLTKSDDNPMYVIFKDRVVNELIIKALLDQEIQKRGIKVSNDDIEQEMKSVIDKVGSKEQLNSILKERKVSNAQFTEDLKTQIKIKKLIDSIQEVKVSDSEAEKYYNSHKAMFKQGERVRASHILISADMLETIRNIRAKNKDITPEELNKKVEEHLDAQKKKAENILAQVKANPNKFEEIARKSSDDKVSGERGGELGYFERDKMVPEFSKEAFSMKPNTISDKLVQTQYGYHIIKVTDRVEPGITPFAKIKEEIKFYLTTEQQVKVLNNLTQGLMKNAKIDYVNESYKPDANLAKKVAELQQQSNSKK